MPKKPTKHSPPGIDAKRKRIKFDFIKSQTFRVLHINGAFGGVSPRGEIQMALFSERWPIPQKTVHELTDKGGQGEEITQEREIRGAVIREVEAQLMMSFDTAKILKKWLDAKLLEIEALEAQKAAKK